MNRWSRWTGLDRFQKVLLLVLSAMAAVFAVLYGVTVSKIGFLYRDVILIPHTENGSTVYAGKLQGAEAAFTVTADKTVTFRWGDREYGPYTAAEDPSAIPKDDESGMSELMTGVELLCGDEVLFRGGVLRSGQELLLFQEDGSWADFGIYATMSDGTVIDGDGNEVDQMEPSPQAILRLMDGPELTHRGVLPAYFGGVLLSLPVGLSILFADELFRWDLRFRIRSPESAEPSDWELFSRKLGWTVAVILIFVLYLIGLTDVP